jgi:hypothetical protein
VWAVGLALFSLSLQILIPLGQALAASYTAGDGFSNQILICTIYGFKHVSTDTGEEIPPEEGGNADCPACMAYAIGMASLANVSAPVLAAPTVTGTESIVISDTARIGIEVPSNYLTRAPPVSA